MKKPVQRDQSGTPRSQRADIKKGEKEGRWAFDLSGESLFALGSTENARRVAYRTATGELRFLPL
jgi:hypothetical protein